MKHSDTFDISDLSPGHEYLITLSNLGTRVATLQFEDASGFHDIPEYDAVSSGDTFTFVVLVPQPADRASNSSTLRVSLTAGAGEIVESTHQLIKNRR